MKPRREDYAPAQCRGCRWWRPMWKCGNDSGWYACHFCIERGRSRKFWLPGSCREYAPKKEGICDV